MIADSTALSPIIEMFGPQSQLVAQSYVAQSECDQGLSEMIDYKILVLCCLASYAVLIYYFRGYISALLGIFTKDSYTEKLMEEQGFLFARFLNVLSFIGIMTATIFVVKLMDMNFGSEIILGLPYWSIWMISLATLLAVSAIDAYRKIMLNIVGRIGSVFSIAYPLKRLLGLIFGVGAVVITPVVFLVAFSNGIVQNIVFYIVVSELLLLLIFMLYKTYMLFVEQNVSIFYWFLYLCIVEAFPITLFVLLVLRSVG